MAVVKVWNDNQFAHTEKFKGQELTIPAGGYIELDEIDAVDFRGQFTPPRSLGPNNPDPRFYKMIRVEASGEPLVKEDQHIFHATGKAFGSPAEVIALAKVFASLNPDLVADDPVAEAQARRREEEGPSKAELLERIAALEALSQRAKPGPKPKVRATA